MSIERRILNRDEIPEEFFQETNVWHKFAQVSFHHFATKSRIVVKEKSGARDDIKWIKTQLGGYNWVFVNMHLSQGHKIAWCAFMFSKVYDLISKPENLHEGPYVRPPAPTKEEWLAQIHASTERELKRKKNVKKRLNLVK